MTAETIPPFTLDPSTTSPDATHGDNGGGGAGRGGAGNGSGSPLVVVQQGRGASPPRPAPRASQGNTDNSLRNGYAAISHSVSGETAAIGLGFLVAGPVGAVIAGTIAPAALAALMWRSRNADHDDNSNGDGSDGGSDRSGSRDRTGGAGNQGRGNGNGGGRGNGGGMGRNNSNGSGSGSAGGRHRGPNGHGNGHGAGGSHHKKPKTKDPIADKLGKLGKDLASKLKNRNPKHGKDDKTSKTPKGTRDTSKNPKAAKDDSSAKGLKDGLRDGLKVKNRGKQPDSDRPWRGRSDKTDKAKTDKTAKDQKKKGNDDTASTARDGLEPKNPNGGPGTGYDEIVDGEIVDDGLPPKPNQPPGDVIDGEVIDEDRIALVRAKREQHKRRQAIAAGKKAADEAARDGHLGDPHHIKLEVIRAHNQAIDLEIHHDNQRLALTAAAETPRSTPVNYPAIPAAPVGTRTAGTAIARQVDFRASTAYAILLAMADQLANGLHRDDDADMGDHIVELTGIPNMCKDLSVAVQEAAAALARTAPLHPSVIKHLNNAAVAARSAGMMADNIMHVFVQAHRADIIRVLDPRIGEERWNLRNGPGTLDAVKLRAAIASAHSARLALPAGTSGNGGGGGGKLVPASGISTKKLINLMKGFTRGHMVNVLSEVAGSAAGVEAVADSVTKLYRRMANTWPTENVVDDTVRATASKVRTVAVELRKAIVAAQRAHERELRLNARPRKGANAEKKWDPAGRPSSN